MSSPVRRYLAEVHKIHALGAGTDEVSLYNPLQNLLNEIGRELKPKVFCIQNLKDLGAGFPDYGLYSAQQLPKTEMGVLTPEIIAERGVIEAKAPRELVEIVAASRQVTDYWERYGLVLVTSFREFLIAGRDQFGRRQDLERFSLAASEEEFCALAAQPARLSKELETRFAEFLTRVLLHNAPLTQARDVAWFLASYARDSLARLEGADAALANLDIVRGTLEAALGVTFEGPKGEHFFRSTLVQTLYYGLFSAWVLWCRQYPDPDARKGFSAAGAAWHLRLLRYFDPAVSHDDLRYLRADVMKDGARYRAEEIRDRLRKREFLEANILRYCYRPLDDRWLYWEPETTLLDRSRPEYRPHVFPGNRWLEAREKQAKTAFDRGYVTRNMGDNFGSGLSSYFPLFLNPDISTNPLTGNIGSVDNPKPNLSRTAKVYLDDRGAGSDWLFDHVVAILRTPAFQAENGGALRQDWPRVPLPADAARLEASAALGRAVAALLDGERGVAGVTEGSLRAELRVIGATRRLGGGGLSNEDLRLTAGWGHAGRNRITMPGPGDARERDYTPLERAAIQEGAEALGLSLDDALACLGASTFDVHLNETAYWANVPARVWSYTLGGYPVLKKWLSYREHALLGRALAPEEARHATEIARRLTALRLLGPRLDDNYRAVTAETYPWPRTDNERA